MSFFQLSDGEEIQAENEFDAGGGNMEPIPSGTKLKAMIENAEWSEWEGERYINIRWSALEPQTYNNRKIFQKVKVHNTDSKKADKAKRMLAAIDANAGGNLVQLGREPTDEDLQVNLLNKIMLIQVQVWEMNGSSGNWVNKVSSGELPAQDTGGGNDMLADEVPF